MRTPFLIVLVMCSLWSLLALAQTPTQTPRNFGKIFATSMAQLLRIQDPDVRALMREAIRKSGAIESYLFSPDGKTLVYWDENLGARVLRMNGQRPKEENVPPFDPALGNDEQQPSRISPPIAAFSPDGRWLAAGNPYLLGYSGTCHFTLFDTRTWKSVRVFAPQENTIISVAFSHDGKRILGGDAGGGVVIYDMASGSVLHRWHYKNYFAHAFVAFAQNLEKEEAVTLIISTKERVVATDTTSYESAQIWNTENDQKVAEFPELVGVEGGVFNSNGTQIALSGDNAQRTEDDRYGSTILVAKWLADPMQKQVVAKRVPLREFALRWTPDDKNLIVGTGYYNPRLPSDQYLSVVDAPFQTPTP